LGTTTAADPAALQQEFRRAMRRLAATVTVITTRVDGVRYGMTATAVTCLSIDPATIIACVNKSASIHDRLTRGGGRFCLNILRDVHTDVARVFAGELKDEERFTVGAWAASAEGLPYLEDAQANLFCTVEGTASHATHTIFFGRVGGVRVWDQVTPLIYRDGGFASVIPAGDLAV